MWLREYPIKKGSSLVTSSFRQEVSSASQEQRHRKVAKTNGSLEPLGSAWVNGRRTRALVRDYSLKTFVNVSSFLFSIFAIWEKKVCFLTNILLQFIVFFLVRLQDEEEFTCCRW